MSPRVAQVVLILATLVLSWLGMQVVHELGHIIGAVVSGGRVEHVSLHPLTFSRTDVNPNPYPLLVVWAGPVLGVAIPVAFWAVVRRTRWRGVFVARFFAGACCVINGLYIAIGSFDSVGDCGVMLSLGSPIWTLWMFGVAATAAGIRLWHRQGASFGFGDGAANVQPRVAMGVVVVTAVIFVLGVCVGR